MFDWFHFLVLLMASKVRFCARLASVESRSPLNKPVLDRPEAELKEGLEVPPLLVELEVFVLLVVDIGCSKSPKPSKPPVTND